MITNALFATEGLKQGGTATLTTALGYCAWNIVDNFGRDKLFNLKEWIKDILSCGQGFNWNEMISQSLVWGAASGVVNGGIKAYQEIKIMRWSYSPQIGPSYRSSMKGSTKLKQEI